MGVLRQSPERTRDAREKQIENEQERQGLQQQQGGLPGNRRDRLGTAMQPDQGACQQGHGDQQPETGGDALRVEIVRQQEEIAEHDDHQGITPAGAFPAA
jgi:hypothetical protein